MGLALGFAVFFFIPLLIIGLVCIGLIILGFKTAENNKVAAIVMIAFGIFGICAASVPGYFLFSLIWELVTFSGLLII